MNLKRVVIDTNVFISALLNPNGTPKKVINLVVYQCVILQSEATYQELETRLTKKKFDKYLTQEDRLDFLASLTQKSLFIDITHKTIICSDVDDNKFLELAVSGMANYLITGDNDLLKIKNYQDVPIITPSNFFSLIEDN
ncbi:MAG: putative toxin-antitoxin system toxin component, PIN family [Crocosphaera sp.]